MCKIQITECLKIYVINRRLFHSLPLWHLLSTLLFQSDSYLDHLQSIFKVHITRLNSKILQLFSILMVSSISFHKQTCICFISNKYFSQVKSYILNLLQFEPQHITCSSPNIRYKPANSALLIILIIINSLIALVSKAFEDILFLIVYWKSSVFSDLKYEIFHNKNHISFKVIILVLTQSLAYAISNC